MKILVTGANGFVGKNLVEYLSKSGEHSVIPLPRAVDLCSYEQTITAMKIIKPEAVLHFAGLVGGVAYNSQNQYKMCEVNSQISINIVKACREESTPHLYGALSTCIYPYGALERFRKDPYKEVVPVEGDLDLGFEPTNYGYALGKSVLAFLIKEAREFGHPGWMCLTPTNLYGEHDNFEKSGAHFIPEVVARFSDAKSNPRKVESLLFHGTGQETRQFMYIQDFCRCIDMLLQAAGKPMPANLNIVDPNCFFSTGAILEELAKLCGYEGKIEFSGKNSGRRTKRVSSAKMTEMFGETNMKFTSIDEGLERTVKWYMENH